MKTTIECPECNGECSYELLVGGWEQPEYDVRMCEECSGSGEIEVEVWYEVCDSIDGDGVQQTCDSLNEAREWVQEHGGTECFEIWKMSDYGSVDGVKVS